MIVLLYLFDFSVQSYTFFFSVSHKFKRILISLSSLFPRNCRASVDGPFCSPKPSLSGNPFFQLPCALALLLCAWRLFRALGCGGVGEVDYMVGFRCGAVAGALLRQSRDTAEALSEMFLVAPCALSEGIAHSLGLLQYSQYCHHSLIRARCGWILLRFYYWQ